MSLLGGLDSNATLMSWHLMLHYNTNQPEHETAVFPNNDTRNPDIGSTEKLVARLRLALRTRMIDGPRGWQQVGETTRKGETRLPGLSTPPVWDGSSPLPLADGWALTADKNRWTLCRARGRTGKWQPIGFIGSHKRVLVRVMREEGVTLTPEAEAAVNALPEEFRTWHRRHYRVSS